MPRPDTLLRFMAPEIAPASVPPLQFDILLPGYDRLGPFSLREDVFIPRRLAPGNYLLKLRLPPETDIELGFALQEGGVTRIGLADLLTPEQRAALDVSAPMPSLHLLPENRIGGQFWIGHSDSAAGFDDFLSEDAYSAIAEDEARDAASLSAFTQSQGARWLDHDALEAGRSDQGATLAERFAGFSWVEDWAPKLALRARDMGLIRPDSVIMLSGDPDRRQDWALESPRDIDLPGLSLRYAGEIGMMVFNIPPYWWRPMPRR